MCFAWYGANAAQCGNGVVNTYDGEITEQPTWMVMDAIRLAGITPVRSGYVVEPHLPMATFSLRLPDVGVAAAPGLLRGYVVPAQGGVLRMQVSRPAGSHGRVVALADGRRANATVRAGLVTFTLPTRAGHAANWAVVAASGR